MMAGRGPIGVEERAGEPRDDDDRDEQIAARCR
jgi:hypothetical protein